ncbi:exodeoxyribonuclease VII small subunit [bacterium]|nr:exodeoxyribonuclease VII small subunit [bacterium]MBU1882349.1 exodeoxyribonuclease VII small subunit [bacterium]
MTTKKKQESFEASILRLEEIVQKLESDAPSLDEAVGLFEEGKTLIAACAKKLDEADQKLQILNEPNASK